MILYISRKLTVVLATACGIFVLSIALSLPALAYTNPGIRQDATQSETPSVTVTPTASSTFTHTPLTSITPSATGSGTAALTQTLTFTPTIASIVATATSAPAGAPTSSSTSISSPMFPTSAIVNTITVIPFPSFTLQFPHKTDTPVVLNAEREPGTGALVKGNAPSLAERLFRYWPLALLFMVWLFLAVWFVIAQRQMD